MTTDFKHGVWLNEPKAWESHAGRLTVVTDARTDFWRETYYGFTRHSGHFLGFPAGSSFTAAVRIQGRFRTLYDQAGLMVRIDDTTWIKAGVEFTDGDMHLSTVITNGQSDWSISQPFKDLEDFHIRVTLDNGALRVQASRDAIIWPLLRLAPFPAAAHCQVGPTACTPEREGLRVSFSEFSIGPAIRTDLHDLG